MVTKTIHISYYCILYYLNASGYPAWLPNTLEEHKTLVVPVISAGLALGVQDGTERHNDISKVFLEDNVEMQFLLIF